MFEIDGKTFRNIQEQVEENKKQIEGFENIQFVLNNFGITVLGVIASAGDIPEQEYSYGDAWLVGEMPPYDMYVYTRDNTPDSDGTFVNLGELAIEGPQGPAGTITVGTVNTGAAGAQVTITNSGTLSNAVLNFTIPKGDKGDTGNGVYSIIKTATEGLVDTYTITYTNGTSTTFTVTNGANGQDGATGDPGESFMIMATLSSASLLPDPSTTPRNHAYIITDGDISTPDALYYITGEVGSEVWSYSSFAAAGTTVSVNGSPTYAWNADTKLDKVTTTSTYSQVYSKTAQGVNQMLDIDNNATAGTIPVRNINGNLKVNETPNFDGDAASKKYVDTGLNKKINKPVATYSNIKVLAQKANSTDIGFYTLSPDVINQAVVKRDNSGQVAVPTTPTNSSHATSKDYVDNRTASSYSSASHSNTYVNSITIGDVLICYGRAGKYQDGETAGSTRTYNITFPSNYNSTDYFVIGNINSDTSDLNNYDPGSYLGTSNKTVSGCSLLIKFSHTYSRGVDFIIIGKKASS